MEAKKHFVLVHGASHGAWCWYKIVSLLKLAGHNVTAVDLGASGVNTKQIHELESFHDYVQPLMEFLASLPLNERVILVGHSYGGLGISLAMENFPDKILAAVFATAHMPNCVDPPAFPLLELFRRAPGDSILDGRATFSPEGIPISVHFGPMYLENIMYQHCQPEDLELAKMVLRPFNFFLKDLMTKESVLTKAKYGSINRFYVVCKEDEVMNEELQIWNIEYNPPMEVKFIDGAGHMVMLSKPEELAHCLQDISNKF